MTAYVFFMIFCSLIGVAVGGIAVFGIFAIRRAIRNKKAGKRVRKEINGEEGIDGYVSLSRSKTFLFSVKPHKTACRW